MGFGENQLRLSFLYPPSDQFNQKKVFGEAKAVSGSPLSDSPKPAVADRDGSQMGASRAGMDREKCGTAF